MDDLLSAGRLGGQGYDSADIRHGRWDTIAGGMLAAIFGIGALVTGAALLRTTAPAFRGWPAPDSRRHSGPYPEVQRPRVFALGLIEAGAVAVLTISASTAYAAGECIGVSRSFNNSPRHALIFYLANIGSP